MDIDLNADLGEGSPNDAELMRLVTSANIACGFHAGDAPTAARTIQLAAQNGVVIGAHPGFPDREHFGRREIHRAERDVYHDCVYQIGALNALAHSAGVKLAYVKPHGALYNRAMRDDAYARPVAAAASLFQLPILGLPGSVMEQCARVEGVPFVAEGYADRGYRDDGSLIPRDEPGAFIHSPAEAVRQVERLIRERGVQSICVHGDNPDAVAFARLLREALATAGFHLQAFA
jgi:UPF0271 protein